MTEEELESGEGRVVDKELSRLDINYLLEELQDLSELLGAQAAGMDSDLSRTLPSLESVADEYENIHQLYTRLKQIYESVRHDREVLKQSLVGLMEARGIKSQLTASGSAVSTSYTIYARVTDREMFVEWALDIGARDLIEVRERKGSKADPGLDEKVRDLVKRARKTHVEPELPPGVSYSEPATLRLKTPKNGQVFDQEVGGILDRIRQALPDQPDQIVKERENNGTAESS